MGGGIFCLIWAKHPDHLPFLLGCTDTTELKAAVEHSILILQNMILSPFSSDILEEAKSWASTLRTFGEETEERGILWLTGQRRPLGICRAQWAPITPNTFLLGGWVESQQE